MPTRGVRDRYQRRTLPQAAGQCCASNGIGRQIHNIFRKPNLRKYLQLRSAKDARRKLWTQSSFEWMILHDIGPFPDQSSRWSRAAPVLPCNWVSYGEHMPLSRDCAERPQHLMPPLRRHQNPQAPVAAQKSVSEGQRVQEASAFTTSSLVALGDVLRPGLVCATPAACRGR
jgi:hypothetical protein